MRGVPVLDYTGPHGGLLAMAFGAGWAIASALWIGVGGVIWKMFIEPRIKALEADKNKLEHEVDTMRTLLLLHGPPALRAAMQTVASEFHNEIDELKKVRAQP